MPTVRMDGSANGHPIIHARTTHQHHATGISLKTLELYLIVFVTRYLDVFTNTTSLYNTLFKIFYISASAGLVYLIRYREPFKSSYLFERDTFLQWKFAVLPCAIIALIFNDINWTGFNVWLIFREVSSGACACHLATETHTKHHLSQYCWAFSLYLEAVAIFPQLVMLTREKDVENITTHYIATLGAYRCVHSACADDPCPVHASLFARRALYILNWIYRVWTEPHYSAWIPWFCGAVQTLLYADFFWQYFKSVRQGTPLKM